MCTSRICEHCRLVVKDCPMIFVDALLWKQYGLLDVRRFHPFWGCKSIYGLGVGFNEFFLGHLKNVGVKSYFRIQTALWKRLLIVVSLILRVIIYAQRQYFVVCKHNILESSTSGYNYTNCFFLLLYWEVQTNVLIFKKVVLCQLI